MTIKTREPGDAFKRQVSEFVPIAKKRRPWRDEEPARGDVDDSSEVKTPPVREVQGAVASDEVTTDSLRSTLEISSRAKSARDTEGSIRGQTQAKIARDGGAQDASQTHAEIARGEVVEAPSPTDVNEVLSEKISSTPSQAKIARVESEKLSTTAQAKSARDPAPESCERSYLSGIAETTTTAKVLSPTRAKTARVGQAQSVFQKDAEHPSNEVSSQAQTKAKIARASHGEPELQSRAKSARDDVVALEAQTHAEIARAQGTALVPTQAKIARDGATELDLPTQAESARVESFHTAKEIDSAATSIAEPLLQVESPSRAKSARDDAPVTLRAGGPADTLSPLHLRSESRAEIARVAAPLVGGMAQAEFARDQALVPCESHLAQEGRGALSPNDRVGLASVTAQLRLPPRATVQKEKLKQPEELEPLPGTRKTRAHFVFNIALKKIDNSAAALLYCYLWHHAEELGTGRFKISVGEMSEAISVARRTLTDAIKRLTEVGLFENVNSGKTTVPDVRVLFELG